MWWDEDQGRWTGYDVPDFPADKRPDYRPAPDARGMDAIGGDDPFIMMADGRGWLYSPSGLLDGPLPTHYEPLESPLPNLLYPKLDATRPRSAGGGRRTHTTRPAIRATRWWRRRSG